MSVDANHAPCPRPRGKRAAGKGALSEGPGRRVAARGLFALGITGGAEAPTQGEGQGRALAPWGGQAGRGTAEQAKRKPEPLVWVLPSRRVHYGGGIGRGHTGPARTCLYANPCMHSVRDLIRLPSPPMSSPPPLV